MKFTKMHGCGNDYVYINCFEENIENPERLAVKMSDRHYGVGADGIILIMPPESDEADFKMKIFNADGSEAEMCGNGVRCIAKYVYEKKLTNKTSIKLSTAGGIKTLNLNIKDNIVESVTVDMGEPILNKCKIPTAGFLGDTVINELIDIFDKAFSITCVSMGNPHTVTFVDDVENYPVEKYGSIIECDSHFPKKTNVEFVEVIDRKNIKMRVWERGSGETLACGTGACASAVACILKNLCDREIKINLLGGELNIIWNEKDNHVYMTGPAEFVFEGEWRQHV